MPTKGVFETKDGRVINAIEEGWCSIPTREGALNQQKERGLLNDKEGVLSMLRRGCSMPTRGLLNANYRGNFMQTKGKDAQY